MKNNPEKVALIQKKYWQSEKGKENSTRNVKKYRKKYPYKVYAHRAVESAVKSGKLVVPNSCQQCQKKNVQLDGHHYNGYDKPNRLNVVWLCRQCHMKESHA